MDRPLPDSGGELPPESPRERALRLVPRPVLTLETIDPDPRCVAIDGADYRLVAYDDLSIFDHARINRLDKRAAETIDLAESDDLADLTDDEIGQLRGAVEDAYSRIVALIVPDAPAESVAALPTLKKRRIHLAFYDAQPGNPSRAAATPATPTGVASFLRSVLATAIGLTGSAARRCVLCSLLIAICLALLLSTR